MNYLPFIISMLAGLSTLFGAASIYIKKDKEIIIKYSLAFASGVMLSMSIIDLLPESIKLLNETLKKNTAYIYLLLITIITLFASSITDKMIKTNENDLYRVGVLSMLAIIIHNIPEGIITFLTAKINIKLGIKIALAITLHNIPEGISIAVPIYYGTKSKKKAILMTLISAISEPFGALLAYIFLKNEITNKTLGIILGIIAVIMSKISIIELLPKSLSYKEKKKTIVFFILGLITMYLSIYLMR